MSGIISDNVGRSSGLLKPVAVAVGGASAAEAANIMINSFNIAAAGGFAFQNMVDGVVDEFEDETGVDTGASSGYVHNNTSSYLTGGGSVATPSAIGLWTGDTGGFTFSGDDVDDSGASGGAAIRSATSFTGDFEIQFTNVTSTGTVVQGLYATSEDGTFSQTSSQWGGRSMTNSFFLDNGNDDDPWYGNTKQADLIIANGSVIKWTRVGDTIKVFDDGTLHYEWTQKYSGAMRYACGSDFRLLNYDDFSFTEVGETDANVIILSNATTARAAPDDANIVIWQQDVDSVTLNTDLKAYASRNGGTTYTQMTLAEVANPTTGRILTGTVDISGQSSATAMKYKIETLNTKQQKIHAVALQWS